MSATMKPAAASSAPATSHAHRKQSARPDSRPLKQGRAGRPPRSRFRETLRVSGYERRELEWLGGWFVFCDVLGVPRPLPPAPCFGPGLSMCSLLPSDRKDTAKPPAERSASRQPTLYAATRRGHPRSPKRYKPGSGSQQARWSFRESKVVV